MKKSTQEIVCRTRGRDTGDDARKHLEFGSDQGETMQGGAMGDHLYGMGGDDIIYVGAGGLFGREKCEAANDEATQVWRMAA